MDVDAMHMEIWDLDTPATNQSWCWSLRTWTEFVVEAFTPSSSKVRNKTNKNFNSNKFKKIRKKRNLQFLIFSVNSFFLVYKLIK